MQTSMSKLQVEILWYIFKNTNLYKFYNCFQRSKSLKIFTVCFLFVRALQIRIIFNYRFLHCVHVSCVVYTKLIVSTLKF